MENAYLNIAKRDIKTAQLLFLSKRYPETVYYLQQACEKSIKSFGVGLGIITAKEAKSEVSHYTWKFLNFFYIYLKKYTDLTHKDITKDKEDNNKNKKYLKEINNKFSSLNTDILTGELEFILNKDKFNERLIKSITDIFGDSFLVNVSSMILLNILTNRQDVKDYIIPMFKLVYIGIMLSNHNQSSRYPFELNNKPIEPRTYYNDENPLIKSFKLIEETMKASILVVEEAFANKDLFEIVEKQK